MDKYNMNVQTHSWPHKHQFIKQVLSNQVKEHSLAALKKMQVFYGLFTSAKEVTLSHMFICLIISRAREKVQKQFVPERPENNAKASLTGFIFLLVSHTNCVTFFANFSQGTVFWS